MLVHRSFLICVARRSFYCSIRIVSFVMHTSLSFAFWNWHFSSADGIYCSPSLLRPQVEISLPIFVTIVVRVYHTTHRTTNCSLAFFWGAKVRLLSVDLCREWIVDLFMMMMMMRMTKQAWMAEQIVFVHTGWNRDTENWSRMSYLGSLLSLKRRSWEANRVGDWMP